LVQKQPDVTTTISSDSIKDDLTATASSGPAVDGRSSTAACGHDPSQGESGNDESSICLRLMVVGMTVVVAVVVVCVVIALVTFVCIKRQPKNTRQQPVVTGTTCSL